MIKHTHDGPIGMSYRDDLYSLQQHLVDGHGVKFGDIDWPIPALVKIHLAQHDPIVKIHFAGDRHMTSGPHHRGDVDLRDVPTAEERRQLTLWADPAMYSAEPQPKSEDGRVRPAVRLIQATADPLGTLAAIVAIYKGSVKRSLAEVTDEERSEALAEMLVTKLSGPLEAITFTILIEGVTRGFTHQMVRGRAAFYAQESMRFAVPDQEEWTGRSALPPSLAIMDEESQPRYLWNSAIEQAEFAYKSLVDMGVPAEDARGLMPHAMTTRLVWQVSLRELLHVAGLRLCTQAQFEWRTVLSLVAKAVREWSTDHPDGGRSEDPWQFQAIADLLRPVCYAEGKCGFMSKFDRGCKIRERVEANAAVGRASSEWGTDKWIGNPDVVTEDGPPFLIKAIRPEEWLTDPGAAR